MYEQYGGNANFRQTFFVSFYRESALGTLRCFTKVLVAGILHEGEKGISRFSVATFLYQSFESFLWELFVVSENFSHRIYLGMWRGLSLFPVDLFRLTIPKCFIGSSSVFQENSGSENFVWMREVDFTFSRRVFFVSQCRKILLGTLPRSRKFPVAKTFYGCEGGYQVFPWKKKFQSQYRKVLLGTLRGLRKFLVFEEINGQDGGYLKVLSKLWSHVTEKIFGNSSGFQRNSGSKKFLWMREGDIRFFGWFFCLTLPKTFFGFSSIFDKASGSENISWMLGGYHVLPSKISGLTLAKTLFGNSFGVSKSFCQRKVYMDERRGYHVFQSKTFESQYRRI